MEQFEFHYSVAIPHLGATAEERPVMDIYDGADWDRDGYRGSHRCDSARPLGRRGRGIPVPRRQRRRRRSEMPRAWAGAFKEKPAGSSRRAELAWDSDRLLKRAVDRGEFSVEVDAEAVDDGDDRQRNAGGNQTVLDSGGPAFVIHEAHKKLGHLKPLVMRRLNHRSRKFRSS